MNNTANYPLIELLLALTAAVDGIPQGRCGKDSPLVVFQHLQPVLDIAGMVLANLLRKGISRSLSCPSSPVSVLLNFDA
jgi:hypothetical protein